MNTFFRSFIALAVIAVLAISFLRPEQADKVADRVLDAVIERGEIEEQTALAPSVTQSYLLKSLRTDAYTNERGVVSIDTIIDATNKERIAAGLTPLVVSDKLSESARLKTLDMITNQYFEHISPNGEGVATLGSKVGYDYIVMGENLALGGFENGTEVVDAWMNSKGHRANILSDNYQEIGVYAAKGMYQGKEVWFAVQHFGTTRASCPSISTTLKNSIDSINKNLKQKQAIITAEKNLLEGDARPSGDEYRNRAAAFNVLVADYNTLIVVSQEKIKSYNAQVAAFNSCLLSFQK